MFTNISLPLKLFEKAEKFLATIPIINILLFTAVFLSILSISYAFFTHTIISYGDAESHLNIAKRVIHSLTPGFAQLGGVWLPLPHLLMVPFVANDYLWRTGLAGSIVSGTAFVVSALYLYRFSYLILKNKLAALSAFLVFVTNPNILYMQATPMTEMPLIAFFVLAIYYFTIFLKDNKNVGSLILSAFFAFCASVSRYDGWFLVVIMSALIILSNIPKDIFKRYAKGIMKAANEEGLIDDSHEPQEELSLIQEYRMIWQRIQGKFVLFASFAFIGIGLWFLWDLLILGDPLYFTNSQFSAKSQQNEWLAKGQLPAYNDIFASISYYFITSMANVGILIFSVALIGMILYLAQRKERQRISITILLLVPFVFYVTTLYIGQSIIFIPHLTPTTFDWNVFNVRYGLMMLPFAAFFFGYAMKRATTLGKIVLSLLLVLQLAFYFTGFSKVYSYIDGTTGLSSAKTPDAQHFMKREYDSGLVLLDDYARTMSITSSGIPMQNIIYVGTKPYWEESLRNPEKYAQWIIMQKDDSVWANLMRDAGTQGNLYKYFTKVYTSPEILIFKRNSAIVAPVIPTQPKVVAKKVVVKPFKIENIDEITLKKTSTYWKFQSVDTMKISRDAARNPDVANQIPEVVRQAASIHATHIALGTPYDDEFNPILRLWVAEARKYNLKIWFRGNFSGWEGWFDYPKLASIDEHHKKTAEFIKNNPDLFEEGDIFTPVPEPENGLITDPRGSDEKAQKFNEFLVKSYNNCLESFKSINKKATCGYFSVNGDVAREVLTRETVQKTGQVVVIDHYVSDPERFGHDIEYLHNKLNANVVIGEFGAPIPDIHGDLSEAGQAAFIDRLMKELVRRRAYVQGLNYWVLEGGTTKVFEDDGTPRLASITLKNFFDPTEVWGTITDERKKPIENVSVNFDIYNITVKTDKNGRYSTKVPSGATDILIKKDGFFDEEKKISVQTLAPLQYDSSLSPISSTFVYRIERFLYQAHQSFEAIKLELFQKSESILYEYK